MVTTTPRISSAILGYLKRDLLLREGHFEFRSGRHSAALLNRDNLLADPEIASRMGYTLAKAFYTDKIETVATPSIWGAGLAQWIAYFLAPRAKVVYATPIKGGDRCIADSLHGMIRDRRVLLVDNIIVSGETISGFANEVEELGGDIINICTLWDLADSEIGGHKVYGLLDEMYPAWLPEDCPLCAEGRDDIEQVPF